MLLSGFRYPRRSIGRVLLLSIILVGGSDAIAQTSRPATSDRANATSLFDDLEPAERSLPTPRRNNNRESSRRSRLARMPKMYGDMLVTGSAVIDNSSSSSALTTTSFPIAGLMKIGENNSPIPQNRIFFVQNHFHNAIHTKRESFVGVSAGDASVNRSTFGFEKTFLDELASVEVRLPFVSDGAVDTADAFSADNSNFDGLSLVLKALLYEGRDTALAMGLGGTVPIGEAKYRFVEDFGSITIDRETVHLSPFVGAAHRCTDSVFVQGFVQVDFPIDDDDVSATVVGSTFDAGELAPPTLLHLDASLGNWFYRNPQAWWITGIASMGELHYTRSISDVQTVNVVDSIGPFTDSDVSLGSPGGIELLNFTAGIHLEIMNRTTVRSAAVVPLMGNPQRSFDVEWMLSINRHF